MELLAGGLVRVVREWVVRRETRVRWKRSKRKRIQIDNRTGQQDAYVTSSGMEQTNQKD